MSETIRVNFGQPVPLFPLPDTVLLPHAILPLHIHEPRYRQLVGHCLDRSGQMAIATFEMPGGESSLDTAPPVRAAVCVGKVIQHEALADGCFNVLLHGVCRARIERVFEPTQTRAYLMVKLAPIEPLDEPPAALPGVRDQLRRLLRRPNLQRMKGIETLVEWVEREDVPTHALLELIGFAVVRDTETRYQLLAEGDPMRRAGVIRTQLRNLNQLVSRADRQSYRSWPKGLSWN